MDKLPEVGQLLYKEIKKNDGQLAYVSLIFVDTPIKEGEQWMYTQIALMEDFGNGLEVYTGIESGGMPPKSISPATDEQIKIFVDNIVKEGESAAEKLKTWVNEVENDSILKNEEKERIKKIVNTL